MRCSHARIASPSRGRGVTVPRSPSCEWILDGRKRDDLTRWLHDDVIPRMEGRILRFDTRAALEWGALQAELEAEGRRMPWRDSVIAATVRRHAFRLATRNVKDFRHAGIDVVNPFEG